MLCMEGVSCVYRAGLVETHALRDLNLKIEDGEFVSITGPSGSGKTTLLNIAGLLEEANSGIYYLDNVSVSGLNDRQRSRIRNEKIGFIFQSFNLFPHLTVMQNITLAPIWVRKKVVVNQKKKLWSY